MNIIEPIQALIAAGTTHALTLWPEWQFPIVALGDKRVENRTWACPRAFVGKTIALHFGKNIGGRSGREAKAEGCRSIVYMARLAGWTVTQVGPWSLEFRRGTEVRLFDADAITTSAIVCIVKIVSVTPPSPVRPDDPYYIGEYGWRFEVVQALDTPIPCKGAQGLWPLRSLLGEDLGEARAGAAWGTA